jgi:hypothetical protein
MQFACRVTEIPQPSSTESPGSLADQKVIQDFGPAALHAFDSSSGFTRQRCVPVLGSERPGALLRRRTGFCAEKICELRARQECRTRRPPVFGYPPEKSALGYCNHSLERESLAGAFGTPPCSDRPRRPSEGRANLAGRPNAGPILARSDLGGPTCATPPTRPDLGGPLNRRSGRAR